MDEYQNYVEILKAKIAAKDFSSDLDAPIKKEKKKPKLTQSQIFEMKKDKK
tara:strand:+ start:364 stop:516 length:153 start_codon:yes stop_codon:yes gene_type:complete